jgi:hypothetical protein
MSEPPPAEKQRARSLAGHANITIESPNSAASDAIEQLRRCSAGTLARRLSNVAQGSAEQRAIQAELRRRFERKAGSDKERELVLLLILVDGLEAGIARDHALELGLVSLRQNRPGRFRAIAAILDEIQRLLRTHRESRHRSAMAALRTQLAALGLTHGAGEIERRRPA